MLTIACVGPTHVINAGSGKQYYNDLLAMEQKVLIAP